MTLTDREYQLMRDAAIAIIREIGVAAGGCNIQFAVSPANGEMLVIEAGETFKHAATISMGETLMATPAISEGVIYVRGGSTLFAIKKERRD